MRARRLLGVLRSPSRAEPVAWALVLAVLAQLWFAAPIVLAMSSPEASAGAACHSDGEHDVPASPASHHHAQCLLCTGGVGPLLATPAPPVLVAPASRSVGDVAPAATLRDVLAAASYRSRAPPSPV